LDFVEFTKCEVWFNGFGSTNCLQLMLGIVGIWKRKIELLNMWMSFIYFEIVSMKHDTSEIYVSEICTVKYAIIEHFKVKKDNYLCN
jgi:hypothetical protein